VRDNKPEEGFILAEKQSGNTVPNVSGSFQVVSEDQQKALKQLEKSNEMDEKSLYYARIFMED